MRRRWLCSLWVSILFMLCSPILIFAQQIPFVEPATNVKLTSHQDERLNAIKNLSTSQDIRVVRLNADALKNSDQVSIPLSHYSVSIQTNSREIRGGKIVSWSG